MCRVTLDFTHAVITSSVLRIDADMQHGKLFIVRCPEHLAGSRVHAKVIEQGPQKKKSD